MEDSQKTVIGELISFSLFAGVWIPILAGVWIPIRNQTLLHDERYCDQIYIMEDKWVIGVLSASVGGGDFRIRINK